VCIAGAVDMIRRMFPPFPIPGFAPNFTGYDLDKYNISWYDVYKFMAQAPQASVTWVSFCYQPVRQTKQNV